MKLKDLNVFKNCRELGISLWQCPQFLFLLMGFIISLSSILVYLIGVKYIQDLYLVALIVVGANLFLLIISFIITHNFEKVAESSRIKSELTGIIIHQLRSPLTNFKWIVETMETGEYKKPIDENLKRMTELTDNLLTITKIEGDSFVLQKSKFFLDKLVLEVLKGFGDICKINNIELDFQYEELEVYADYYQLRLVIENLIGNSIRYTKDGGKIEINIFKKNNKNIFKIKDQGVGIPEKDKKFIFQKFFRSNNILKNKIKGSGLGLYITKTIIEKHKGKIWFETEENKGATFYFSI